MKHLRALTMYDHIPTGCVLQPVTNDDSAPHIRASSSFSLPKFCAIGSL
jgi:hypothetical protein